MGATYLYDKMDALWTKLEADGDNEGLTRGRKYNRLDLKEEFGFRLSCSFPDRSLELLIELVRSNTLSDLSFPNWKGMKFELVSLAVPKRESLHLSLKLENREFRDVFISLCADLADDLIQADSENREAILAIFLDRWTKFFERYGQGGLSPEKQRGLYGELCWLQTLLENGIGCIRALNAWKGCERGYHDFEINGQVVEVKTTMTKEPRKVCINNERQLDSRGLISLHLLVLSLIKAESGGESLPSLVDSITSAVSAFPGGQKRFELCLSEAGYLDIHSHLYTDTYTVKKEELFNVEEGFPKITDVPDGLGDIRYTLTVAAAGNFLSDVDEYLALVKGAM